MAWDLQILETGNGGDFNYLGGDLKVVSGIENMPYLGMYGGNLEAVTDPKTLTDQAADWWGNWFMISQPSIQFNSLTEKTINTVSLTSSGRVLIENAVKSDLKFLSDLGCTVSVEVEIAAIDRINIRIKILMPNGTKRLILIDYRKTATGDFFIFDFNDDFFV